MSSFAQTSAALEKYRRAGRIACDVMKRTQQQVHSGQQIIRVCEAAESMIRRNGAVPAFPLNLSINHIAAHYSSPPNDMSTIPEDGLVKLDLGVSVEGYIVDMARTIDLSGKESLMVNVAEEALNVAISTIKPGINTGTVGWAINQVITKAGLKPISNLTGHRIARNELHSGVSVPNVPIQSGHVMREGEVYAIEPFVTEKNGKGLVKESKDAFIFSCGEPGTSNGGQDTVKLALHRKLRGRFGHLPFSTRWIDPEISLKQLKSLVSSGLTYSYPVLVEAAKKIVAQAEHTIMVRKHGCEVLTALRG